MTYSIAIFSEIPVYRCGDGLFTDALWVRDLSAQISVTESCRLIAPVFPGPPDTREIEPLPESIDVKPSNQLSDAGQADELTAGFDVVQVPGSSPIWKSRSSSLLLDSARRNGAVGILGISSNRAKTMILNAKSSPLNPLRVIKGYIDAAGLIAAQRQLAQNSDGLLLVGEGLTSLTAARGRNVHIGTASWIREEDVISQAALSTRLQNLTHNKPLKICIATRLERMKGVHIALEALDLARARLGANAPNLTILGAGPELRNLQNQVSLLGLNDLVSFEGTRQYPKPFFQEIEQHDVMLLSNLNDEQPRLVFDAGARGLAVICPDSASYRGIMAPNIIRYARGQSKALADAIVSIEDRSALTKAITASWELAHEHTIDEMHKARAAWISQVAAKKSARKQSLSEQSLNNALSNK